MKKNSKQFQGLFSIGVICLLLMTPLFISCGSSGDGVNGGNINTLQNGDNIAGNGSDNASGDDLQFSSSDLTETIIAAHGVDDARTILPAPADDYVYVRVQRDLRKCASPVCGGFFISALNKRELRCSDGTQSERCYVAEIDWSKTSLSSSQIKELENAAATGRVILTGQIRPLVNFTDVNDFKRDTLGVFAAGRAWMAATGAEPKGHFFRVKDLGIRCFTTPCFFMRAFLLNRFKSVDISDLDLSGVHAKDDQVWKALAEGTLLVAGNLSRSAVYKRGRTLTASQIHLPVNPLECNVDDDCTVSVYTAPVDGTEDCYCQTCPVPISVKEAMSNEKQWKEYCEDVRLICPLYPCVMPGPVGCVNNTCEYLPDSLTN